MKEIELKSKGAVSYSSAMKRRRLLSVAAVLLICCLAFVGAVGATDGVKVAKVDSTKGSTEYTNIDWAIGNWTAGTTLTLLSDVTLSDVVQLKSTEYHILDLGTYTMTAAPKKNAIEITCAGQTSLSDALTINADAENPGGITATGGACVKTTGKSGVKDRPITIINGGVFTASNCLSHSGSNGANAPQFKINGGTFNGDISANRAMILIYGGTFNGKLICSVDSSAYMRIQGGRFTELKNNYWSVLNSDKFTIGSAKGNFDRVVYVDDEGYYVVCTNEGKLICGASVSVSYGSNEYLYYSSAATNGLYYKDIAAALEFAKYKGTITLFDEYGDNFNVANEGSLTLDITDDNADLTSTVTLGSGASKFIIKYKVDEPISWTVVGKDGRKVTNSTTEKDGVVTNTYEHLFAITFNTAGGNEIPQIEQTSGTTVIAPEDPTKEGYTFAVWDREIPSTMPAEDLTITASWTANTSTVHFDANGGEGTMNDQPFTYDVEQSLTALNFTKVGHTFNGWNTAADGSGTEYADAQIVKNLTTENNGVVTLYANWTINPYTITFLDGGSEIAKITQDFGTAVTAPANPSKSGYRFVGWDKAIPTTMPAEDLTLTASWTANTYTVKFDANGGEGTMADQPFTYDEESKALTPNAFTRDGYIFNGWNTVSSGSGIAYSDKQNVRNLTAVNGGTVTLYAQWKENPQTPVVTPDDNKPNRVPITTTPKTTYKVTFYPNGGSGEMNAVTFVEGEQKAIPVNTFTREGYTFKGWALTSGGEVFYTDGEPVLIDGATSLYAVWEEVSLEKPEEPTDDPSDKPTEPTSPAPLFAVLAGLGAAVVLRRR